MEQITEYVNEEMKKKYNENIFNFEIDKEIKFLDGDYANKLSSKQKKILDTVELVIIDNLFMVVEDYFKLLHNILTSCVLRRKFKQFMDIDKFIKNISTVKQTARYLYSLRGCY